MSEELTRRELLKGALVGGGALAGLGGISFTTAHAASTPNRGGVWRYARNRTAPSMDVQRASDVFTYSLAMYDCLLETEINPKTYEVKLVPGLATAWQFEKGNTRIVFILRKGVVFHDGSKFNADAVKWNLDRLRSDPKCFLRSDLSEIDSVEVLNDNTVAVNLKYPSAPLPYVLSSGRIWGAMVSKAFQEKHGDDELGRKGCGTGAFRLKDWIVDDKVVLERFPDYWKQGADGKSLPYLDGMEEVFRPKIDQAMIDLRAGSLETVHFPMPRDVVKLRERPELVYVELPPFEFHDFGCWFNPRRGPFTSLDLRRACCYAIDRERFVKLMGFGISRPHMYPFVAPGQSGWSPKDWPDYTYNAQKSKDLVKAAYPRGVAINLLTTAREPDTTQAELIKAMWEAVGIKTEIKTLERLEWNNYMYNSKDEFEAAFSAGASELGGFVRPRFYTNGSINHGHISIPRLDQLLDEHARTFSEAKRHEIMKEAFKIIFEQALVTCASALTNAVGTHKKVQGIRTPWRMLVASEIWLA